jgi:carbonic anhydrase
MPVTHSLVPPHALLFARRLALLALGAFGGLPASASEQAAKPAPPTIAASAATGELAASTTPADRKKTRSVPLVAGRDPLDVIRERLAQKLGAVKPAEAPSPNVLRVVAKTRLADATAADPTIAPPRPSQRRARVASSPEPLHAIAGAHPAHWDYAGSSGPEAWGRMKPEFAKCASGTRQSPIDIRDGLKLELDAVRFDYQPRAFRVVDNGHTIQVNLAAGNAIEAMGRRYELVQFHFHRPSEERIDGHQFDMVAHLVHKDLEGRLAVVAVLLERGPALGIVQSVWNNLPLEKGDEVAARTLLDLNELLPSQRSYFTYMGSLTTPPCSEGVLWMVMKQPVGVSAEQLAIFARLYPMNARPIQSASGRLIKESN